MSDELIDIGRGFKVMSDTPNHEYWKTLPINARFGFGSSKLEVVHFNNVLSQYSQGKISQQTLTNAVSPICSVPLNDLSDPDSNIVSEWDLIL